MKLVQCLVLSGFQQKFFEVISSTSGDPSIQFQPSSSPVKQKDVFSGVAKKKVSFNVDMVDQVRASHTINEWIRQTTGSALKIEQSTRTLSVGKVFGIMMET